MDDALELLSPLPLGNMLLEGRSRGGNQPSTAEALASGRLDFPTRVVMEECGFGDTGTEPNVFVEVPYRCSVLEIRPQLGVRRKSFSPSECAPDCRIRKAVVGKLAVDPRSGVSLSCTSARCHD